jgi:hypothetical protein
MPDRTSHPDLLADRAKRDAQRLTPGFSPALHGRVMMSVNRAAPAEAMVIEPEPSRPGLRYRIGWVAMAASLALAVVPTVIFTFARPEIDTVQLPPVIRHSDTPGTLKKPQLALYATAHEVNSKVTNIVQTAMAEQQFAGLDHDVRAATAYLVDQVPLRSAWQSNQSSQER